MGQCMNLPPVLPVTQLYLDLVQSALVLSSLGQSRVRLLSVPCLFRVSGNRTVKLAQRARVTGYVYDMNTPLPLPSNQLLPSLTLKLTALPFCLQKNEIKFSWGSKRCGV